MAAASSASSNSNSVLTSPFFRTEIVLGLAHDSLSSPHFPKKELAEVFSSTPLPSNVGSSSVIPIASLSNFDLPRLEESQRRSLEQAVKALSSQLALPENQLRLSHTSTNEEPDPIKSTISSSSKLTLNHVRLQLGGCLLLMGELTRSGAQLELVSNDLRPSRSRKNPKSAFKNQIHQSEDSVGSLNDKKHQEKVGEKVIEEVSSSKSNSDLTSKAEITLRIKSLVALAKVCRLQGKENDARKYEKWANESREKIVKEFEGNR